MNKTDSWLPVVAESLCGQTLPSGATLAVKDAAWLILVLAQLLDQEGLYVSNSD